MATAITPLAVLETVMVKGYQTLVDEHTAVSYRDAMEAALKLNEIARKDEGAMDRARMLADMGRIIEVVRTFIPSERWPDVQAALRGEAPVSSRHRRRVKGCAWWDRRHPGRGRQLMGEVTREELAAMTDQELSTRPEQN